MSESTNGVVRRRDILNAMSRGASINKKQANEALNSALAYITDSLVDNKSVTLTGFGTFKPTLKAERTIRVPNTIGSPATSGKIMIIPEHRRVSFKPGKNLADAVR